MFRIAHPAVPHGSEFVSLPKAVPSRCSRETWQRYWDLLVDRRVKDTVRPWYTRHVEAYLEAVGDRHAELHVAGDVERYLDLLGRRASLVAWQYAQVVDALRLFFVGAICAQWAGEFDWGHWKDSARQLGPEHTTLAREQPAAVAPDGRRGRRQDKQRLAEVRASHREVVDRLATEIRRRAYSIRTEQAYSNWTCRFIAFCGGSDPRSLGAGEVRHFLEHLAVRRTVSASTQNQALNALVFLYGQVLERPLGELEGFQRAKRPRRLPVVLTSCHP